MLVVVQSLSALVQDQHEEVLAERDAAMQATLEAQKAGQMKRIMRQMLQSALQAAWRTWEAFVVAAQKAAVLKSKAKEHAEMMADLHAGGELMLEASRMADELAASQAEVAALKAQTQRLEVKLAEQAAASKALEIQASGGAAELATKFAASAAEVTRLQQRLAEASAETERDDVQDLQVFITIFIIIL